MPAQTIQISGARQHNLKNLHVEIPREKLASTVLTKAPQIVSGLQEFTQALNEKAGPKPEVVP